MKIHYDEESDTLRIELSRSPVVRDVSRNWKVSLGYGEDGLVEITVLEARASGLWPCSTDEIAALARSLSAGAAHIGPFSVKLADCGDGSGDAWLPIPDAVMECLGLRIGDTLSVRPREPGVVTLEKDQNG